MRILPLKLKLLYSLTVLAVGAYGQVTSIMPAPRIQFFGNNGQTLPGGKVYTYAAGTTTPLATYTDSTGTVANTNPVILDAGGFAGIWLSGVAYKIELRTSTDTLVYTVDNVYDWGQVLRADLASSATGKGATLIGYQPAGGGLPMTVAQALDAGKPWYDVVVGYGASCDGIANDAVKIQNAINAASAAGGGAVLLPNGKTCNIGTTGISIPANTYGIRIFTSSFGGTTLTYSGAGAAITLGAAGQFTYRHTLENIKVDITNAGANAVGILSYPSLYVKLLSVWVTTANAFGAAANQQVGIKLQGGSAADSTFGAYLYCRNPQVQGKFRKGVYVTANGIGWGFNASTFTGGGVLYEGVAPAGQTPPYTGIHLEQGNENLFQMIDVENYDVNIKSEAYDNSFLGTRTEFGVTKGFVLAAATGSTSGGTFNRLFGGFSSDGVQDLSAGSVQLWGWLNAGNVENHITNIAYLDTNLTVTGNYALTWNNVSGSAGLFWKDGAGNIIGSLVDSSNPTLTCGRAADVRDCVLNTFSVTRFQYQATDKFTIDSTANTSKQQMLFSGNIGVTFSNAGGGGSTGLAFNTAPAAAYSGQIIDNGSQNIWSAGSGTVARDLVLDVANAASANRLRRFGTDYLVLDSNGLNVSVGIYKNGAGAQHIRVPAASVCSTAAAVGATCDQLTTLGTSFSNTAYTPVCTIEAVGTGVPVVLGIVNKTATTITVRIAALTAAAANGGIDCWMVHD